MICLAALGFSTMLVGSFNEKKREREKGKEGRKEKEKRKRKRYLPHSKALYT
jgi:hypothetical protein